MKLYIKSNSNSGYLYIFKHGVGPGTIPKDVAFLKEKDLPNGYTAVWLDRFLTDRELKAYDIPSETEINYYLDRIGYCQKNGDVVPCEDVKASDEIEDTWSIEDEMPYGFDKSSNCSNWGTDEWAFYIASQLDLPKDVYYALFDDLENLRGDEWLTDAEEATQDNPEMFECFKRFVNSDEEDVDACDNITASDICYRDRDNDDRVVALDAGMSDEDVEKMLSEHPSYYRSTLDRFEACDNVIAYDHRYSAGRIEDDGSEDFYYDTGFDSWDEACDWGINHECTHIYDREKNEYVPIESCDTKYFANMVSASNNSNYSKYRVCGYYDSDKRGLAASEDVDDIQLVNAWANEYANKGYYITIEDREAGSIMEISADTWFEYWYPSGITSDLF